MRCGKPTGSLCHPPPHSRQSKLGFITHGQAIQYTNKGAILTHPTRQIQSSCNCRVVSDKESEIKVVFCINNGFAEWGRGERVHLVEGYIG
jgi:hypothetical protein